MSTKGALIAAVAAGLFSAGAPLIANAGDSAKVHCEGVNSCKGKGWMEMSEKECKDKGGKVTQAGK